MGYDTGGNVTNSRLALALANDNFNGGNYNYWINDDGTQKGEGLGVTLGNIGGNGKFAATEFQDVASGDGLAGNIIGTVPSSSLIGAGEHQLVVGKYIWGAGTDTLEIYVPDTNLNLGSPISTLNTDVDQSKFDTLTFARGDKVVMDEIRFGSTLDDVLGANDPAPINATLTAGNIIEIMNTNEDPDNKADISVFPGAAGYQGIGGNPNANTTGEPAPVSGIFGDGTVEDYAFFKSPLDKNVSLDLVTYASGSSRIGTVTANSAGQVSGSQSLIQVWETSDPSGFTTSADYTSNTMAGLGLGSGSIDISDMLSGQLYFLAGGYGGEEKFTLTMKGAGQPDIVVTSKDSWPRPNRVHLHDFTFDNPDLLYTTILFEFDHSDNDGSAARFGGVILDGVLTPEPASFALFALGGLILMRRRPSRLT